MATNTNCPATAGRATLIHSGLPRQAPTSPKNACETLSTKARMRANTPSSGAMNTPLARLARRLRGGRVGRRRLLLERGGHLRRHVLLVVLGEDLVGDEGPIRTHGAVRDDALALAEQVRQHARVLDRNLVREVREHEAHLQVAGL